MYHFLFVSGGFCWRGGGDGGAARNPSGESRNQFAVSQQSAQTTRNNKNLEES